MFIHLKDFCILLLFGIGMMVLQSCSETSSVRYSAVEKSYTDSLMRTISNIDTLAIHLDIYKSKNNLEGQMMCLKQLGRRQRELNKFADAIDSHTQGLNIAIQLCDTPEIIYALNNIGTNYRRMGMLEDATIFHYRALKYCENYSDKETYGARKNRVVSLNGIGNISLRLGDYSTADSVFRAALKGESELGSALGQAINYANLAAIFEQKNLLDSAWHYYNKSMEMNIKAKSDLGISLCHEYFGGLYEKEGKIDSAILEYNKAFTMKGRIDDWHWLNSCLSLAQLYIKQGNYTKARQLLTQAETVALACRSRDHSASIYALLSVLDEKTGNPTQALAYYKKSHNYNDSIISEKNLIQMQNERVQYEYQRRQQEIETLQANYIQEKNFNNIMVWAIIAIATLFIATIILLTYALALRKKRNQALQQLDDARTSFFTNITHEFRTPLTVIVGVSEELTRISGGG